MMRKDGLKICGVSMFDEIKHLLYNKLEKIPLDHLFSFYEFEPFKRRDVICSELIWNNFDKNISNILIVGGNIPLVYLDKFKCYNLTFIDNNACFLYCREYIKEKYNCEVINLNPVTEDLSAFISANDLIIYPETETLVPFDLLRYNHKNKMIFCSNFLFYDFKINNNLAYNEDDLASMCYIKNILIKGKNILNFKDETRNFYYVMGNGR